jgi:rhamnose utilization protein RhaD (predicted bifunctional aldolase and dehydrogenase)/NAD(P)-dependent dehydrogenase (short-subunit alcohol dehydrogenase family)
MLETVDSSLIIDRVRTSRALGSNKALVLHGGGNTSVKVIEKNVLGEEEEILYVKGSGWDLETIDVAGFSPVRISHLKKLAELDELSDSSMVNELITHLTNSLAPVPSVEAILHAIIPYTFVDHTHADAVVAITNSVNGEQIIRQIYGDKVIVIPYVMPGFDLSKLCFQYLKDELSENIIGIVLLNHGIFSFGNSADESYQRMQDLVMIADEYLDKHARIEFNNETFSIEYPTLDIANLRSEISKSAGFPVIMKRHTDNKSMSFCNRSDLSVVSQQGPATPDHVIRTKRLPMLGRDVTKYAGDYITYFEENEPFAKSRKKILDVAPRVILDSKLGLCTIGKTVKDAKIVSDIYSHTIDIILWAQMLGGYKALSARDIFDVEYWELEQAKLNKVGNNPVFTGEVVLVTGAASGIGKACVESFLKRGAAVVGLDINSKIINLFSNENYLGIQVDLTSEEKIKEALDNAVNTFGGLDILVLNAGIFPTSKKISELQTDEWKKVINVNLDSSFTLLRDSFPLLKLSPKGGRVVIIGSKNVAAPGPGAAAYSASKAALNQLARVAALEWGEHDIRINTIHPNAVFDTGIWSDEILASRAKNYGITIEEYKTNNVLKVEVTSNDVSELAAEMCGPAFSKTTGCQIAVDGGNDRVI